MKTLEELAQKYDNDKAVVKADGTGHGYTPHYERYFESVRKKEIKVLEIGVAAGPSIQMWLDYFPKARVYGVDFVSDTNPWNTVGADTHDRYKFIHGDQSSWDFWKGFVEKEGNFDIVIDDGGHKNAQIIITFCSLWQALNPSGLYCVEDLGVGYGAGSIFVIPGYPSHGEFFKAKVDEILQGQHGIYFMSVSKELAIIKKK